MGDIGSHFHLSLLYEGSEKVLRRIGKKKLFTLNRLPLVVIPVRELLRGEIIQGVVLEKVKSGRSVAKGLVAKKYKEGESNPRPQPY
jgi:hypothetical protein